MVLIEEDRRTANLHTQLLCALRDTEGKRVAGINGTTQVLSSVYWEHSLGCCLSVYMGYCT